MGYELSPNKTQFLAIRRKNYVNSNSNAAVTVNGHTITMIDRVRDLGVEIQSDLEPTAHIIDITFKAQKKINLLMRVLKSKKPSVYRKAFISLVRPILEYASSVWCPSYAKDVTMLENIQKSFSRRVFAKCGLSRCEYADRLKFLKLSKLSDRRLYIDLILTFKILTCNIDLNVDDFFVMYNGPSIGHGRKIYPHHVNSLVRTDTQLNTLSHRIYAT
jgi:hypothetical protein